MRAAKGLAELRRLGVTHVLNAAGGDNETKTPPGFYDGLEY
eukprot:gene13555-10871_t